MTPVLGDPYSPPEVQGDPNAAGPPQPPCSIVPLGDTRGTHAGVVLIELQADGSGVSLISGTVAAEGREGTLQGTEHTAVVAVPPSGTAQPPQAAPRSPRGCPRLCAGLWWPMTQWDAQGWP